MSHIHDVWLTAAALNLDTAVHPCDDFYGFVCNKWIENNPPSHANPIWNDRIRIQSQVPYQTRGKIYIPNQG